jgi:hypothetical protein
MNSENGGLSPKTSASSFRITGLSERWPAEMETNSPGINAKVYTQTTDAGLRRAIERVGTALKHSTLITDCSLSNELVD